MGEIDKCFERHGLMNSLSGKGLRRAQALNNFGKEVAYGMSSSALWEE